MKNLALVSFLLVAAACAPPTNTNTAVNTNTNTMMPAKASAPSEADITAKEKGAWDAIKKKDYDGFGNMLTSDYVEVTDDAVFDKAGIVADVKDFNLTDATFSDWKMLPIDNDAVILTYQTTLKATYKGAEVPPGPYRSAAVWVNRDGKWLAFYYQQTPVKTMPPPPPAASPSASKSDKAAATPAAKSAETGTDPIANEKMVWEAILSKNYDGFASFLAPDAIELEPDGYFDKASSVKLIGMFDPTGLQTSDWKAVKIDNDAAFVTYTVTSPAASKMGPERHSTVWVNRNGKWLALMHVGTPESKPAAKTDTKPDMKKM
jgi:hypothetical protein